MFFLALRTSYAQFSDWTRKRISASQFLRFRNIFVAIWLMYDVLDVLYHGTVNVFWDLGDPKIVQSITVCQIGLIIFQTIILLGYFPRVLAFGCLCFRGYIAYHFRLNDFFFYCVICVILTQCKVTPPIYHGKTVLHPHRTMHRWPLDVLLMQTAWVYFATAVLKMTPIWLSGGGLYVRMEEVRINSGWQYPEMYHAIISNPSLLSWFSNLAVLGEVTVACLIFHCAQKDAQAKQSLRYLLCFLVFCIHTFAAVTVNVCFFGATMIAIVFTLCSKPYPSQISQAGTNP